MAISKNDSIIIKTALPGIVFCRYEVITVERENTVITAVFLRSLKGRNVLPLWF